jgi:hypothetical protein
LQRKGALFPTALGHSSLPSVSVLAGFAHVTTPGFEDASALVPVPGGRGSPLALATDVQSGFGIVLSAEAARPCLHVGALAGELDVLRELAADGAAQMSRLKWRATASDAHLACALCALSFAGCLPPPAHTLHGPAQAYAATALDGARRVVDIEAGARPEVRVQIHMHSHGRRVWRATGYPDFLVTPNDDFHMALALDEMYFSACCVLFGLSPQQGPSVDARAAVLQTLLTGVTLELAREARRQEYAAAGLPGPPGLARPVAVVMLVRGWRTVRRGDLAARCRAYVFSWAHGVGVRYWRSRALTVAAALDYAHAQCF